MYLEDYIPYEPTNCERNEQKKLAGRPYANTYNDFVFQFTQIYIYIHL